MSRAEFKPRGAASGAAGFTLLEVLVVLTVLGLLMVGLTQGMRTGVRFWNAQGQQIEATAELDSAARVLRELITGIQPAHPQPIANAPDGVPNSDSASRVLRGFLTGISHPPPENSGIENGSAMTGLPDRLSFIGRLPTGLGGTRTAEMTVTDHNGRLVLVWRARRHEQIMTEPAAPIETELVRDVAAVQFSYWGKLADGSVGWQSGWSGAQLPTLVRLRMAFAPGDRRRWPDLVAAPRL